MRRPRKLGAPPALIAAGVAVAMVLGGVQLASMSVYGRLAQRPAFPAMLPPSLGLRLARPLGSPRAPAALRVAYARALVFAGGVDAAQTVVAGLPAGADAAELRGELAERRGDLLGAIAAYAQAGDLERAQGLIDDRVNAGDVALAARFERQLVEVLEGPGQAAVRARAQWRLGQIEEREALDAQSDPVQRLAHERRALGWYERALVIAPNDETYLLAAGQQSLVLGDAARAAAFYRKALDVVPDSADARAGLARAHP